MAELYLYQLHWYVLNLSFSAVLVADSSGDGGFPEEAWRVLRGSEAVPEECLRSERLLSVSPADGSQFHPCFAAAAAHCHNPPRLNI